LYYRTLKAAFTKAIAWGYISENPFKKIKLPRQIKSNPAFISLEELHRITDVTGVKLLRDIFITAFFTGMRLGEIVSMKWDWIDLNSNVLVIRNDSGFCTKSKKERTIPIHNEVKDILTTYQKNLTSQYVFTMKPGIKICPDYISRNFKKSVKMIGLNNNIHFHSLRHSFASRLVQQGVSLYVVKELLGHESLSTAQIYSHLMHENLASAIRSI
jgi:site-specific recombinase XerD